MVIHKLTDLVIPNDHIKIEAKVTDKSKIKWVIIYYKEQPSYTDWQLTEMKLNKENIYEITLPLSSHGLLYYFEVFDEEMNGKNYPDPEFETPYFIVEAWETRANRK